MIQKTNCLRKNDFESYEVILPFTKKKKKKRKLFLCSELEKLHPCFSDEFAFDSKIRKISRKGMMADVLVVNKYKLAEYESRRRMSGSGFYIEDRKSFHRFFVNQKWKNFVFLTLASFVFLAAIIVNNVQKKQTRQESPELLESRESQETREIQETQAIQERQAILESQKVLPGEMTEKFFAAISDAKGKITSFEWKTEGGTKVMKASLEGIYPEQLKSVKEGLEFSSPEENVIYEESVPKMKVSYSFRADIADTFAGTAVIGQEKIPALSNSDFNKSLRNLVRQSGASLKQENAPPYHLEFDYTCTEEKSKKTFENLFEDLSELVEQNRRVVTAFSIQSHRNSEAKGLNFRIGISIEQITSQVIEGFDLAGISKYIDLFIDGQDMKKLPAPESALQVAGGTSQNGYETKYIKIGEIKKSEAGGGSDKSGTASQGSSAGTFTTVTFYKTDSGKILSVVSKK